VASKNNLLFFIFNDLTIVYTIFVKKFQQSIFVLLISICAEIYFVVISWLLCSLSNLFIKFIASLLNPFADGKYNK